MPATFATALTAIKSHRQAPSVIISTRNGSCNKKKMQEVSLETMMRET